MEQSGFTLESKLLSLFVVESSVNLSRFVPACSCSRLKIYQFSTC